MARPTSTSSHTPASHHPNPYPQNVQASATKQSQRITPQYWYSQNQPHTTAAMAQSTRSPLSGPSASISARCPYKQRSRICIQHSNPPSCRQSKSVPLSTSTGRTLCHINRNHLVPFTAMTPWKTAASTTSSGPYKKSKARHIISPARCTRTRDSQTSPLTTHRAAAKLTTGV